MADHLEPRTGGERYFAKRKTDAEYLAAYLDAKQRIKDRTAEEADE